MFNQAKGYLEKKMKTDLLVDVTLRAQTCFLK